MILTLWLYLNDSVSVVLPLWLFLWLYLVDSVSDFASVTIPLWLPFGQSYFISNYHAVHQCFHKVCLLTNTDFVKLIIILIIFHLNHWLQGLYPLLSGNKEHFSPLVLLHCFSQLFIMSSQSFGQSSYGASECLNISMKFVISIKFARLLSTSGSVTSLAKVVMFLAPLTMSAQRSWWYYWLSVVRRTSSVRQLLL